MELPNLNQTERKGIRLPFVKNKTRFESFCENCRQNSIKWNFCFICGFETR